MANKPVSKIKVDREIFMRALNSRGLSVEKLCDIPEIGYASTSVYRGLHGDGITERLFWRIAYYLQLSPKELGAIGRFDNSSEFDGWSNEARRET